MAETNQSSDDTELSRGAIFRGIPSYSANRSFVSIGQLSKMQPLVSGGQSVINDIRECRMANGEKVIVKLCSNSWKREKTLTELSSLVYLSDATSLPVPKVYGYEIDSANSEIHREYIVLEKLPGVPWSLLELEPRVEENLVSEMGRYVAELRLFSCGQIGNARISSENTLQSGPIVELINLGHNDSVECFHSFLQAFVFSYSRGILKKWSSNNAVVARFSRCFERLERNVGHRLANWLPNETDSFPLSHQDLVKKNILIHEGKISGILDWEWAGFSMFHMECLSGLNFLTSLRTREIFNEAVGSDWFQVSVEHRLAYDLISHLYKILSCDEWGKGKLTITARFLSDKLGQKKIEGDLIEYINTEIMRLELVLLKIEERSS